MRASYVLAVAMTIAACGSDGGDANNVHFVTDDVTLAPGQEVTMCYFVHTKNTKDILINQWDSTLTPGVHHVIVYRNESGIQPEDGTAREECGIVGTGAGVFMFAGTQKHEVNDFPFDSEANLPIAQTFPAKAAVYLEAHMINTTDQTLQAHVDITGNTMEAGAAHTETQAYVTYNNGMSIPPGAVNHVESAHCPTPPGAKYWMVQAHSHKQTVLDTISKDGGLSAFYSNTDWAMPSVMYPPMPGVTFQNDTAYWSCTYNNTGDNAANTIQSGPSAAKNEMCVILSYYYPATDPKICVYDPSIPELCDCV